MLTILKKSRIIVILFAGGQNRRKAITTKDANKMNRAARVNEVMGLLDAGDVAGAREAFLADGSDWVTDLDMRYRWDGMNSAYVELAGPFQSNGQVWFPGHSSAATSSKTVPAQHHLCFLRPRKPGVDFEGLVKALGIARSEVVNRLRAQLEKIDFSRPIICPLGYAGATEAEKYHFLVKAWFNGEDAWQRELRVAAEECLLRTTLRSHGSCGAWDDEWSACPLIHTERVSVKFRNTVTSDPIVDRLLALGWSLAEVRQEFVEAMQHAFVYKWQRPLHMIAMRRSKCFTGPEPFLDALIEAYNSNLSDRG